MGVRLRPSEAVTIVLELVRQVTRGHVPGMPSAHVIRLLPAGQVAVEGPVAAGGRAVSRAATLLDSLLPPFDAPTELRAPGALRLIVARALGTLDLPPYESLEDFAHALERFGEPDAETTVRRLTASWARAASAPSEQLPPAGEAHAELARTNRERDRGTTATALVRRDPASLTISDIRRARRATGLPLEQISARSRIPVPLLRQLEWGYLHQWPTGLYGRTQLVRYARAAGLDEQIVTSTVWPLLEEVDRERVASAEAAVDAEVVAVDAVEVVPVAEPAEIIDDPGELPLQHVEPAAGSAAATGRRSLARRAAVLLGAAAVLALLTIPATQDRALSNWRSLLSGSPSTTMSDTTVPGEPPLVADRAREPQPDPAAVPAAQQGDSPASAQPAERSVPSAPPPAALASENIGTTGAERVPAAGLTAGETAWSPSFASIGSAMFYHAQDGRAGPSALVRADTNGEGAILRITRVVDDNARNFHARPSPDGSKIAFDSDRAGERAVYVADADGANVRRVSGDGFGAVPSWSPDGRSLAFVRAEPDRPRVWNLWLADLDTGELRRLTSHRYGQPWGASWFPDGRRVAYSHEDRLIVLDLESGVERVFRSPRKGRLLRTPAVSPDGERIIFQVYRDGAWLLDLDDGAMRKVLADPTAEEYAWSPDGDRVAYHSRRSGEWGVWIMLEK